MKIKKILMLLSCTLTIQVSHAQRFIHPGLLQSQDDIVRIQKAVRQKTEPIYTAFVEFSSHSLSRYDYQLHVPMPTIGRNPTVGQATYDNDASAAYQNAMMWVITGDRRYAEKAESIIDGWAEALKEINGKDAVLMAGLGPFKMVNAAEILRYTDSHWSARHIKQAERHFKMVVYPVIKDFAPFANGNWDGAALKTMMAIAIFTNDRLMFERALNYYTHGGGDGCITNYIINETGQCQESGRDQSHTQLGLGHLADCCEMAWHQGLDLYGIADNRLLKGFEYTASFNLGNTVPFQRTLDCTGKYAQNKISEEARGRLRPIYEEVYNHFVNRRGVTAPYTALAAAKLRPEGAAPGADHMGFGTLLYSITGKSTQVVKPNPPTAVFAQSEKGNIILQWIPVNGVKKYVVTRVGNNGKTKIFTGIDTNHFVDKYVRKGHLYSYRIAGIGKRNNNPSTSVTICAGWPENWACTQVGTGKARGDMQYDGRSFVLNATGKDNDTIQSDFTWAFRRFSGNGVLIARFVPQLSSQFSSFGIRIQSPTVNPVTAVNLMVKPIFGSNLEVPSWCVQLLKTDSSGTVRTYTPVLLPEPQVSWGRLTGSVWLKLVRKGNIVNAFTADESQNWRSAGSMEICLENELNWGLRASSGLVDASTPVKFDHVSLSTYR